MDIEMLAIKAWIAYLNYVDGSIKSRLGKLKSSYDESTSFDLEAFKLIRDSAAYDNFLGSLQPYSKRELKRKGLTTSQDPMSSEEIVDTVYERLFKRKAEDEGKRYWLKVAKELNKKGELGKLPFYVLEGARGDDEIIINDKVKFVKRYISLGDTEYTKLNSIIEDEKSEDAPGEKDPSLEIVDQGKLDECDCTQFFD